MANNELHKLSTDELITIIKNQQKENQKLKSNYEEIIQLLIEQLNLLRYNLFGTKTEKLPENPEDREFDEAAEPDNKEEIIEADESIWVNGHQRKKKRWQQWEIWA